MISPELLDKVSKALDAEALEAIKAHNEEYIKDVGQEQQCVATLQGYRKFLENVATHQGTSKAILMALGMGFSTGRRYASTEALEAMCKES